MSYYIEGTWSYVETGIDEDTGIPYYLHYRNPRIVNEVRQNERDSEFVKIRAGRNKEIRKVLYWNNGWEDEVEVKWTKSWKQLTKNKKQYGAVAPMVEDTFEEDYYQFYERYKECNEFRYQEELDEYGGFPNERIYSF